MNFDLWALDEEEDSQNPVGGGEIKAISCLLPRKKKKGKLYPGSLLNFPSKVYFVTHYSRRSTQTHCTTFGPCGATRETYALNKQLD